MSSPHSIKLNINHIIRSDMVGFHFFSCFILLRSSLGVDAVVLSTGSSDLTNLFLPISVGLPPQTLLVGVGFDRSTSWLYSTGECPPFVRCFNSGSSGSFAFLDQRMTVTSDRVTMDGFRCMEYFHLTEDLSFETEFTHTNFYRGSSLSFRDIAGQLALGPRSDVARNHVIELKVDVPLVPKSVQSKPRWSIAIDPAKPQLTETQIEVLADIKAQDHTWKFVSKLMIDREEVYRKIFVSFVPDMDDFVIPQSEQTIVLANLVPDLLPYKVSSEGRLFIQCQGGHSPASTERLGDIKLRIHPTASRFIRILPQALQFSGSINTNSIIYEEKVRFCPTRIVFSDRARGWAIGLPLMASVQAVYLDGRNSRMAFRLLASQSQRAFSVVHEDKALIPSYQSIPAFGIPGIVRSGKGSDAKVSIQFTSGWTQVGGMSSGELILFRKDPTTGSEPGEFRFYFVKKRTSLLLPRLDVPTITEIEEVLQMAKLEAKASVEGTDTSKVSFDFDVATDPDASSYSVSIVDGRLMVQIVLRKIPTVIDLGNFDIPTPSTADDDKSCRICFEEIEKGNAVQRLRCGDEFHADCIQRWLGTNRSCPACRAEVLLRSRDGKFLLRRVSTTPDPEEYEDEGDESSSV
jgi:hypothetical protein